MCEKVFVGEQYLQAHQQRRHPELSNSEPFSNQNKEVDNLQQQVRDLQDRLRVTEEALKQNHESSTPDVAVLQAMLQSELQVTYIGTMYNSDLPEFIFQNVCSHRETGFRK